jgi:hypothetical protein
MAAVFSSKGSVGGPNTSRSKKDVLSPLSNRSKNKANLLESERRLQIGGEDYFISNVPSKKYETNNLELHSASNMKADNSFDKRVRSNHSQGSFSRKKKDSSQMIKSDRLSPPNKNIRDIVIARKLKSKEKDRLGNNFSPRMRKMS